MTILLSYLRLKLLAICFAVALWRVIEYITHATQSNNYQLRRHPPGFTLPFTVTVLDANKKQLTKGFTVTPPQVTVKMVIQADAITVAKPVGWTLTGQPAAGYRVSNVQIAPLEVQASGLQTTLGNIVLLATDPIDVSGATADVVRTVTIRPPDGVSVNQKTAQVHVFIARAAGVSPSPGP